MRPRETDEPHRSSTPLELFFDLVFVVAVASAAAELHHGLAAGRLSSVGGFAMAFLAIWWAWVNFTWFASAYDCDDVAYRWATFVIMGGALTFAAAVPELAHRSQSVLAVVGYCVMRLGMVALWLRASGADPHRRTTCLSYAAGIVSVQVFWVLRLFIDERSWVVATFALGMAWEMAVPPLAEWFGGRTPYHPGHIAERYAGFTIIVLGEVILSTVLALQQAPDSGSLLILAVGAMLLVFGLWWVYFKRDLEPLFRSDSMVFAVGYGHLPVFAAVAATGAGLATSVDVLTGTSTASPVFAGYTVAVPVAGYCVLVAMLQAALDRRTTAPVPGVVVAGAVLVVPLLPLAVPVMVLLVGLVLAVAVIQHAVLAGRGR